MNESIKILMVDDHPMILDGYKNILNKSLGEKKNLLIDFAFNCEDAFNKIETSLNTSPYHLIYLDVSLPPAKKLKILCGEDLGIKIREISPQSKIIIMTMYSENMRIYNLMKNIKPEGLLIKTDVNPLEFLSSFEKVIAGNLYYSQTINEMLRNQFINELVLDPIDRSILFHISKGVKTKDLAGIVNLSLPAIEKRKRNIKEAIGVKQGGDLVLVDKAKELGFL
ncbi:response regulator transcription factor [Antarcticibacterium arcticum]|uniref:Response regulator transcription factor n=1 Tax=Antarcticibacterium arcticum TaxID=2585771 RepID=A0A5B8YNZ8_9FLAO|nr:response regulator [Antarcticibacterium arcticum]QED38968.1 response regulator transcription factor [Antarcticibacterium arcticum]